MKALQIEITEAELTFCILSHRITQDLFMHPLLGPYCEIQKYGDDAYYVWNREVIDKLAVDKKVLMLMTCREVEAKSAESKGSEEPEEGNKETGAEA